MDQSNDETENKQPIESPQQTSTETNNTEPVTQPPQPVQPIQSLPTPSTEPVVQAVAPVNNTQPAGQVSAGLLVLQWLTYAFWGWTLLALSSLTVTVLTSIFLSEGSGEFTAYNIAAVIVLLPVAFVCDTFYSRKEPSKKVGASLAVMVIHAVLFALIAMGSLIVAVFTIVSMLISSGGAETKLVALAGSLIICFYYLLTFLRVLNPVRFSNILGKFRFVMLGIILLMIILGIVGPISKERATKDDRLIEANIGRLSTDINTYARTNKKLPDSLNQLDLEGDVKVMVDRNLIEYNPNTASPKTNTNSSRSQTSSSKVYYYELCANFKEESDYYSSYRDDQYSTYISGSQHPAGRHCFKASTTSYN